MRARTRSALGGVLHDVVDSLVDRLDALRLLVRDLHAELILELHDELDEVEGVGVEVVLEGRLRRDLALFDSFPDFSEGRMAKVRSHVVSRASCAVVARELGLGERLRDEATGPPDEVERLARNRNVLAALLEAAIAAVYLEHGFELTEAAIVEAFAPRIEYALTSHVDHKTELQEQLARTGRTVSYTTLNVDGPPHDRSFTAAAMIGDEIVGTGVGRSKKDAEQQAAREALVAVSGGAGGAGPASPATE